MSAYIVDNITIFNVIRSINLVYGGGSRYERLQGLKTKAKMYPQRVFEDLAKLNERSIIERYGEDHQMKNGKNSDFDYRLFDQYLNSNANLFQLLKSFNCFMYQSCEGDCRHEEIYQDLEHIKKDLAMKIALNDPRYEQAEWQ